MLNRLVKVAGVALVMTAGVAGCADAQTMPRKAARLTLDGTTHLTSPPACSQVGADQYRTIDIRDRGGHVEAVVLISGDRAIPQWVKIRNIDGFNGSCVGRRSGPDPRRPCQEHLHDHRQRLRHQQQQSQQGRNDRLQDRRRLLRHASSGAEGPRLFKRTCDRPIDGGPVKKRLHWLVLHGFVRGVAKIGARRGDLPARLIADPSVVADPVSFYDELQRAGPAAEGPGHLPGRRPHARS